MDKLVTWSNSQEANEEECSSFMDRAGAGLETASHNGELCSAFTF